MTQPVKPSDSRWPVWRSSTVKALRAMLGEIEGLPIMGGESSARVSPAGVETGRWVAGFSRVGVSVERLRELPDRLGMPAEGAERFRAELPRARQIYLAIEQTSTQVVAKVYLEHALSAPDLQNRAPKHRQVSLSISSCKWRVDVPYRDSRETEYWRMSGLDGAATVALLNESQGLIPAAKNLYAGVAQVLAQALATAPDWHGHRLLVVREPGTTRHGVGVRFYGSELRVGSVVEPLSHLLTAWGLAPDCLSDLRSLWTTQELGWLHAGLDAQAQPYLNIYGALNRADTRAVLSQLDAARFEPRATMQES